MNALTQSRCMTVCIFLVAAFIAAFALIAAQPSDVAANMESMSVTNSRGALHVTIPYRADHGGAGQLTLEVLDPEDQVVVRTQRHVEASAGHGHWQEDLKLEKPVPIESLVWHRLRYRFTFSDGDDATARHIVARSWAVAHGLAMLILDGHLPADDGLIDAAIGSPNSNKFGC